MRILFLTALLASVAAPALAAPQHDRHSSEQSSDNSDRKAERPERAERPQRAERPERPQRAERPQPVERPERAAPQVRPDRAVQVREARPARPIQVREPREVERVQPSSDGNDGVRNWRPAQERVRSERPAAVVQRVVDRDNARESLQRRIERRVEGGDGALNPVQRRIERRGERDGIRDNRPPRVSRVPVEGTQPSLDVPAAHRDRDGDRTHRRDRDRTHRWSGNWRNDRRYDWRDYRNRHRSTFRIGVYFDPFGWNYRRYNVGWRLWPSYYSSRYWINDPYMYRLPYAPPGYRWIRYYDDAVLVDTWTGQVEDVIYNFFW
jgi:hypothetical protein